MDIFINFVVLPLTGLLALFIMRSNAFQWCWKTILFPIINGLAKFGWAIFRDLAVVFWCVFIVLPFRIIFWFSFGFLLSLIIFPFTYNQKRGTQSYG